MLASGASVPKANKAQTAHLVFRLIWRDHIEPSGMINTTMSLIMLMVDDRIKTRYWLMHVLPQGSPYGTHCSVVASVKAIV